jgi:outer membrane protein OmpA-like peptidoglycan-associated protein
MLGGCASVPKDAPAAIHEAAAELKTADEIKTDKLLPKTIASSEEQLQESVKEFKSVPRESRNSTDWTTHSSVLKATKVKERAQKANAIRKDIYAIDGRLDSIEGTATISGLGREVAGLRTQLAALEKGATSSQASFSMLSKMPLHGPTVYFDTAKTSISQHDKSALRELAKTMRENPELKLKLVGYADPRGADKYNQALSQKRAEEVRSFLTTSGLQPAQVTVEALGATTAFYKKELEKLQLERRVEMMVLPR